MKIQDLYEGRQDKVQTLIQNELWPIAKRLEKKLKNGQTITLRDKDGSVLKDSVAKAIEIVTQYKGNNAEMHIRAIQAAHDYTQVQQILSNVLLHGDGQAVVR